jgi:hypothetical protein
MNPNAGKKHKSASSDVERPRTDPALIAILAAVIDPRAFSDNAGPAIRRADRIIKQVQQYLEGKNPNLQESFEAFVPELRLRNREASEWGFAEPLSPNIHRAQDQFPEGVMSFEEALKNRLIGQYKTKQGLIKFLESEGYPEWALKLQAITKVGCEIVKQKHLDKEARQKRQSRKKKSTASKKAKS